MYNSGVTVLNETFKGIYDDFMKRKGDEAQSPAQIVKEFPIEIIPYENIFEVLHEAIQKRGYGHYGCFFKCEQTTVARDSRINKPKVLSKFKQLVCFRGEVYEFTSNKGDSLNTFTFTCDNGEWRERKVLQDIRGKWHLWDGSYNVEIWVDKDKQIISTNPPKPIKIYPAE